MKNKSLFSQIIFVIIIAIICLMVTFGLSLLAGSLNVDLFSFRNLNFLNMIPMLLICGFISCIIVGILILFVIRSVWVKAKDYFNENNKEKGENKK